jgi:nitrogenase molybdenum-iron protein alpha/beta subunit
MERLLTERKVDALIGSSTDINAVSTLDPSRFIRMDPSGTWTGSGPKIIEFGFPCRDHHVVSSSPTMGFAGVLSWADRIINAPRLWDTWRNQPT